MADASRHTSPRDASRVAVCTSTAAAPRVRGAKRSRDDVMPEAGRGVAVGSPPRRAPDIFLMRPCGRRSTTTTWTAERTAPPRVLVSFLGFLSHFLASTQETGGEGGVDRDGDLRQKKTFMARTQQWEIIIIIKCSFNLDLDPSASLSGSSLPISFDVPQAPPHPGSSPRQSIICLGEV